MMHLVEMIMIMTIMMKMIIMRIVQRLMRDH